MSFGKDSIAFEWKQVVLCLFRCFDPTLDHRPYNKKNRHGLGLELKPSTKLTNLFHFDTTTHNIPLILYMHHILNQLCRGLMRDHILYIYFIHILYMAIHFISKFTHSIHILYRTYCNARGTLTHVEGIHV